jgi:hypothetical protein
MVAVAFFATCAIVDIDLRHIVAGTTDSGMAAYAGGRGSGKFDDGAQGRAQELAKKAQERAEEQAKKAQERAEEQARQAQERAQTQAQTNANSGRSQDQTRTSSDRAQQQSSTDQKADDKSVASTAAPSAATSTADKTDNKSENRGRSDTKNDATIKNDDPPNSIAEWLQRLTQPAATPPQSAVTPTKSAERPTTPTPQSTSQPAKPAQAADKPAQAQAAAKPKGPGPASLVPALPTLAAPGVLAVNPSAEVVARALNMGFKVSQSTDLAQLRMSIVRMVPPSGMDASSARELLGQSMSLDKFVVNKIYRPYRAANADTEGARSERPRPAGNAGCAPERCYGMQAIGWRQDLGSCSKGLRIGVIDTAVDHLHPAFKDSRIQIGTFIAEGRKAAVSPHGTGILALLGGSPQSGTPGLLPDAEFYVGDIFHADENGHAFADSVALLKALDWMDAWGVKIVNMSVAGPHDELMEKAVETLSRKGMIFVAAAGNEGPTAGPMFPAAYKSVIAVTAVAKDMRSFRRANRGDYIDVAAPGVDVWTAVPGAQENFQSGTSFAVPFVTAAVATAYRQAKIKSKAGLLDSLSYKDLGAPGRDPVFGRGLLLAPTGCAAPQSSPAPFPAPSPATPVATGPAVMSPASAATMGMGFAATKP